MHYCQVLWDFGRHGGLTVSVLDSGLSGLGSGHGRGHWVVFLGKHFTLTVPLFTQVYKWVLVNLMLGVALHWTSMIHPAGNRNTPSRFMRQKPG